MMVKSCDGDAIAGYVVDRGLGVALASPCNVFLLTGWAGCVGMRGVGVLFGLCISRPSDRPDGHVFLVDLSHDLPTQLFC